ncbi:MAG: methyltransferase domain-containing protein [Candidatus Thorarchaeota archaeon]
MSKESSFETPVQKIELKYLPQEGLIIDIGGGGEGLVSRIEASRVCAVDINLDKIREAMIHGQVSQWILSDGRMLSAKNERFRVATLWFSLGYVRDWTAKAQVVSEVDRVLMQSGHISILGAKIACSEARFVLRAHLHFPDGSISQMSYGMSGGQKQDIETVAKLLQETGYGDITCEDNEYWFHIEAEKLQKLKVGTVCLSGQLRSQVEKNEPSSMVEKRQQTRTHLDFPGNSWPSPNSNPLACTDLHQCAKR